MSAYWLPDGRQITGALTVRAGARPAAKYECLVCETTEMVRGVEPVTEFVRTIRTTHPATCTGVPQKTRTEPVAA
ncbi:hypothetical protein ACFU98_44425 [Streptomyces sp. NPDC057575]|uniref:hypothetical protein n=1 Tax=unclassified Streptomyces TaxID=2593676 RepID=UPI00369D4245